VSTLYWLKVARKARLYKQPEYPNFEALLEAEAEQPSDDFANAAKYVPPSLTFAGVIFAVVVTAMRHNAGMLTVAVPFAFVAAVLWFLFTYLDRRIPKSRQLVRKRAKEIAQRVCGFSNIVGVEPAMIPAVGVMLEEAARIYMKHRSDTPTPSSEKALLALEEGMGKIMELAVPPTLQQRQELEKKWAYPLLDEMKEVDRVLDEHANRALDASTSKGYDTFSRLQQARMELQGYDSAVEELEQKH